MDYKKVKTETSTVTRNHRDFNKATGNLYKSLRMLSRRADQINVEIKKELTQKLEEFATTGDNLEEVFENREQIEIAKYYEKIPKPTLIAIHEYLTDKLILTEKEEEDLLAIKKTAAE